MYNPAIGFDFSTFSLPPFFRVPDLSVIRAFDVYVTAGSMYMYNSHKKSPPPSPLKTDVLFFIRDVDFATRSDCRKRIRTRLARHVIVAR